MLARTASRQHRLPTLIQSKSALGSLASASGCQCSFTGRALHCRACHGLSIPRPLHQRRNTSVNALAGSSQLQGPQRLNGIIDRTRPYGIHTSENNENENEDKRNLVMSDAQRRTIYALSTPPGKAGVGVIRISGPDVQKVWHAMVRTKSRKRGSESSPRSWQFYRCGVVHPETGETLDEGLAVFFKGVSSIVTFYHLRATECVCQQMSGPRSFTAEDVLELHVHSGRAVISSVLGALACLPYCRLAEPGEFTRRAFSAGHMDLTQVEGVKDLINAETESQRKVAVQATAVRGFQVSYFCVSFLLNHFTLGTSSGLVI